MGIINHRYTDRVCTCVYVCVCNNEVRCNIVCMFIVGGRGRGVARAERRTESPADLCGEEDTNIYENMREHLRQSLRQDRCGDADNEDEGDIDIE